MLGIIRALPPLAAAESEWWHSLIRPSPRQRKTTLTAQKRPSLSAFNSLVVTAVDSMLRRANRAQAEIQGHHDQALVGAERSRVGIPPSPGLWRNKSAWPLCLEQAGLGTRAAKECDHGFLGFHR
jgi:hypothetical protein